MATFYVNREGQGYRETVSEINAETETAARREAENEAGEYQFSDPSGRYWVSRRACSGWDDEA